MSIEIIVPSNLWKILFGAYCSLKSY